MLIHSPQELANLINSHRKSLKLSQSQVSSKVGLKQTTISRLENKPESTELATLFRILSALDLEVDITPKLKNKNSLWKEQW